MPFALFIFLPAIAHAEPLSLEEINRFNGWYNVWNAVPPQGLTLPMLGRGTILNAPPVVNSSDRTLQAEGYGWGPAKRQWERNGAVPTDREDLTLALYGSTINVPEDIRDFLLVTEAVILTKLPETFRVK